MDSLKVHCVSSSIKSLQKQQIRSSILKFSNRPKTFCDLNLCPFCNILQNVDTTFIVNSVMSRLFDKHVNDWHNCLSLERFVSGRGGNKLRTYQL
jgi:uncharacterized protein with PIN domain